MRFPFPSLLPMGYVDMVMLNQNRKIKKTSKKSPPSSNWRMKMSLFRMLSLSLSLSIYLFAYLDLWLTMIGTKSETPSSNSPWPKPRPSSLHRTEEAEGEVTKLEESMSDLREELQQLKVALYARFGRGINLEA